MRRDETRIIKEMRKNSRLIVSDTAKRTGIKPERIHRIMRGMESKRIVKKHASIIDFYRAGFPIRAFFVLKAGKEQELMDFIEKSQSINNASLLKDRLFFIDAVFSTMKEFYEFKEAIGQKGFKEEICSHVFEELKVEGFIV